MCGVGLDAQEIGFIENFALAKPRTKALKLLIAGSEESYCFHGRHYRNTEQVDESLKAKTKQVNPFPGLRSSLARQTAGG